jgi:hypothetical protein
MREMQGQKCQSYKTKAAKALSLTINVTQSLRGFGQIEQTIAEPTFFVSNDQKTSLPSP